MGSRCAVLCVSFYLAALMMRPGLAPCTGGEVPDLGSRRQGVDWPCFLGPTQDSKSPERGLKANYGVAGPKLVWQTDVGLGYSMPTISRGRLYLFDAVGREARLRCLHSETGKLLWQFKYPFEYEDLYGYDNGPRCFPIVDDDRVYLFGVDGQLHCLSVTDGRQLWIVDTQENFGVVQNFFGVGSTPVIEGDLLIVQVGGSPPEDQKLPPGRLDLVRGNGTAVVAFDKLTGQVKYSTSDELASYATPVLATIGERRWCFVFARGGLLGFDPTTGKEDFHFPWRAKILESVNASNPVVVGDRVFISECYGPGSALLQVRPGGCEVVWSDGERRRQKAMQTHWNTSIYHDGYLYGSSGRHPGEAELRCVDFATGEVQWSQPDLSRCSLLYADGHFVCLAEYGQVHLLRVNSQKFDLVETWELTERQANPSVFGPEPLIRYPAWAAPVLSHGLLYLRGRNRLVCLELIPDAS